jgi:glutathione S-transferase
MITVHHLDNSRSQRALWLLEELGLPYEIRAYKRNPKTMQAPPELKAVHPLGKSPIVVVDGITLAESGAIIEFFVDREGGKLRPAAGTPERLDYTYFLHYAEGSAMPLMVMKLVFATIPKRPMPFFVRPIARGISQKVQETFIDPQIRTHLDFLEAHLTRHTWFAGEAFTAADIQMSFAVLAGLARGSAGQRYPRLQGFIQRIQDRPAYRQAIVRGGPLQLPGG